MDWNEKMEMGDVLQGAEGSMEVQHTHSRHATGEKLNTHSKNWHKERQMGGEGANEKRMLKPKTVEKGGGRRWSQHMEG